MEAPGTERGGGCRMILFSSFLQANYNPLSTICDIFRVSVCVCLCELAPTKTELSFLYAADSISKWSPWVVCWLVAPFFASAMKFIFVVFLFVVGE